jgi:hypothetical protein
VQIPHLSSIASITASWRMRNVSTRLPDRATESAGPLEWVAEARVFDGGCLAMNDVRHAFAAGGGRS